eukprot:evm.model.scf_2008.2 EVM.evm.TU.scf_2008.2   scf_2008:8770-11280(+)
MASAAGGDSACRALFSCCLRETHTHKAGFKQLFRRLRTLFRPEKLDSREDISPGRLAGAGLVVFGCPRDRLSRSELQALEGYINGGGSVLVLLGEGGETGAGTNINYLLEEFGVAVNPDAVVGMVHSRYLHPKEVLIADGVLNRALLRGGGKGSGGPRAKGKGVLAEVDTNEGDGGEGGGQEGPLDTRGLHFVYPYGATLSVQKPAVPVLSSGGVAFPMNRPLAAVWEKEGTGKLAVLGSAKIFDDKWIDKEDNSKLMDFFFRWLKPKSKVVLDPHDAEDPNVAEVQHIPDIESLAERLQCCLQEEDELPKDWTRLIDDRLFQFDTSLVPEAMALYDRLGVKKAPLTLIAPQFESPLPPLRPAVFPPAIRELDPPALELFDLDEHFSDEQTKLAIVTNKCSGADDLEYYIRECSRILGLDAEVGASPKGVLEEVFRRLVRYKMPGAALEADFTGPGVLETPDSSSRP